MLLAPPRPALPSVIYEPCLPTETDRVRTYSQRIVLSMPLIEEFPSSLRQASASQHLLYTFTNVDHI